MEEAVVELLEDKGALTLKKLHKKVAKKLHRQGDDQDILLSELQSCIEELLTIRRIMEQNHGAYAINKAIDSKRKRAGLDDTATTSSSNKRNKVDEENTANTSQWNYPEMWKNGERYWKEESLDPEYLRTNPDRITRLFCGNLNRNITEDDLHSYLPGITFIKWITDKETGEFYGSSFIEFRDPEAAALAVMKDRAKHMGRPLKIYYCPPRPGDQWPPTSAGRGGGSASGVKPPSLGSAKRQQELQQKREENQRPRGEKPDNCCKLFIGNLSYEMDDDTIVDFFKDCGEMVGLRWLTHKDTGEFRGCGYVQFAKTEDADKGRLLDGQMLMGRPIKIDWTN